jgi:PAS domain S-box-containing protein
VWLENNRRAFAGERVEGEVELTVRGEKRLYHNIIAPICDDAEFYGILGVNVDVTERKRAEEALRKAHDEMAQRVEERTVELSDASRRLAATLESITDGFVSFDRQWRFTYVNAAATRFLRKSREELLGNVGWEIFPETSRLKFYTEFNRALEENVPVHFEEFYPDPLNAWYECHCYPSPKGLSVYFSDVTERKQAEKALQESEAKYRALVEASPDGVLMADLDGRITFASPRMLDLYGSEHIEEMYGRDPLDFVAPGEHRKFQTYVRDTREQGITRDAEFVFVKKDGTHFPGETSAAVIRNADGTPKVFVGLVRDVTERKRIEKALRQSHDQLQAIYDGMQDGLVVVDIGTQRFLRANAAMCRMVGYTQDELLSMSVTDIHPPAALSRVRADFEELTQGRRVTVEAIPVLRKDGSIFYVDIYTSLVTYNGRPCSTGFFCDITERRAFERELSEIISHQQQRMGQQLHDGLGQQLLGLRLIAAGLHKSLAAQELREAESAGELTSALDAAQRHIRAMIQVVQPVEVDAAGLMTALADLARGTQELADITCTFECKQPVHCQNNYVATQLFYIAQEACTNALKHARARQITLGLQQDDRGLRLWVRDDGTGIRPEAGKTAGMGLRIARYRAGMIGASLAIERVEGGGTLVTCVLPSESI